MDPINIQPNLSKRIPQNLTLKNRFKFLLIGFMFIGNMSFAQAQSTKANIPWAVTTDVSVPFGFGIAGSYEAIPTKLNARVQWHIPFPINLKNITTNGFQVSPKLKLGNIGIYADWFPLNNNFRVTGGLALMSNMDLSANGTKEAGKQFSVAQNGNQTSFTYSNKTYNVANGTTYQYAGKTYTLNNGVLTNNTDATDNIDMIANITELNKTVADIEINSKLKFKPVAPYIGIGYGNPYIHKKWSFFFDFGLFLTGAPTMEYTISSNCSADTSQVKTACNALTQELNTQSDAVMSNVNSKTKNLKFLPQLSVGATYSF